MIVSNFTDSRKRCLAVGDGTATSANGKTMRMFMASCQALGITYQRVWADAMPSNDYINLFDFVCIIQANNSDNAKAIFNNTGITIPILAMGCNGFNGKLGSNAGVIGSRTALSSLFIDMPWSAEKYFALYTGSYVLDGGTALSTISAVIPPGMTTSGAQTDAGNVVMWSSIGAGGNSIYYSAVWSEAQPVLPFLIQAAINDGQITATGFNKAPMFMGLDHPNSLAVHAETTIIDKIVSYIPKGGMMTVGVLSGEGNTDAIDNMPEDLIDRFKALSGNKFRYTYHEHRVGLQPMSGSWPLSLVTEQTKAEQYDNYSSLEALWNAKGLILEGKGLYNAGAQSWNTETMELFSRDTNKMSSPNNDTVQTGKGFCMFRSIAASDRVASDKQSLFSLNQITTKRKFRGIQLFNTWDLSMDVMGSPYNQAGDWSNHFRNTLQAISNGMDLYIHADPFISSQQEPGVQHHGYTAMQMYVDTGAYLKDLAKPFADPVEYIT